MESIELIPSPVHPWTLKRYGEAHHAQKAFMDEHNNKVGEPNREEEQVPFLKRIKSNVRATSTEMLRLYLKQLKQFYLQPIEDPSLIPGFRTFTPSLAKLRGCSERTIQNHRKILLDTRVIIKEENHGANGILIWFNPEIIFKPTGEIQVATYNQIEKIIPKPFPVSDETKNLHLLGHVLQDQLDEIKPVDKEGNTKSSLSHLPQSVSPQDLNKTKAKEGELALSNTKKTPKARKPHLKQQEGYNSTEKWNEFRRSLIEDFWIMAKHLIYPGEKFRPEYETLVKRLIWETVFLRMPRAHGEEYWRQYLTTCKKRIKWAANWAAKNEGYTFLDPLFYFGTEKKPGTFKVTEDWEQKTWVNREWKKINTIAKFYKDGRLITFVNGKEYGSTYSEMYKRLQAHLEERQLTELACRFRQEIARNPKYLLPK